MTRQRSTVQRFWGRAALGLAAACSALALLAPAALADPQSDAVAAIDAAWSAAGGDQSELGDRDGDVYAAGAGFGQDFSGGTIFFTPETGAHTMYGEILAKYRALGGPAESDLGFPSVDEVPGRISVESRNSIFSAADQPVIFWTPEFGAWVVRGAINAAWDAVGGSAGTLGVPTADQTRTGDVVSQTFAGGKLSFDTVTRQFTTEPADLAQQLGNLTIPGEAPAAPPTETTPAAPSTTATLTTPAAPTDVTPTSPAAPQADGSGEFQWQNWWLWWIIPLAALLLGSLVAWLASRRRHRAASPSRAAAPTATKSAAFDDRDEHPSWVPSGRDRENEADHWLSEGPQSGRADPDAPLFGAHQPFSEIDDVLADEAAPEAESVAFREVTSAAPEFELFTHRGAHAALEDPDAVDTAPTAVQSGYPEDEAPTGRHAAVDVDQPTFDAGAYQRYGYRGYEDEDHEGYVAPAHGTPAEAMEADVFHPGDTDDSGPQEVVEAEEFHRVGEPVVSAGDEGSVAPDSAVDPVEVPSALHLPLDDPNRGPEGYPVKGRMSTGTYHTPGSAGYDAVSAEIWFADAAHAEDNGFVRGD